MSPTQWLLFNAVLACIFFALLLTGTEGRKFSTAMMAEADAPNPSAFPYTWNDLRKFLFYAYAYVLFFADFIYVIQ
jgi:hypothetical protein